MKNYLIILAVILVNLNISSALSTTIVINNQVVTINSLSDQNYEISDNAELHVSNPTLGTTGIIDLKSESGWLFLDHVLPSEAIASYLTNIRVNGQSAVNKTNVKVTNYLRGCVIMAHSSTYEALTIYKDENYGGDQMKLSPYTYYRKAQLGTFDDAVSSFKLKRGYMATFAVNEDGTRYSKVYIADDSDINIPVLPNGLNNQVSFIRVFPWRYTGKKGFGFVPSIAGPKKLNCDWYYNWNSKTTDDFTDIEFVPMKWNAKTTSDKGWTDIVNLQGVTHVLGFNEPEKSDQSNMTVDQQIEMWPKILESGLRVGSPAPSRGGTSKLFEFIDRCDALNYRVDFVAIHSYKEETAEEFYNYCKSIYDRTKRPIWVTEFNYGGDWLPGDPTYDEVAARVAEVCGKFDTAHIIERYAIFDLDNFEKQRSVFYEPTTDYVPTPMGTFYMNNVASTAFKPAYEFFYPYHYIAPTQLTAKSVGGKLVHLTWKNDGSNTQSVTVERTAAGGTAFQVIASLNGNVESYDDMAPNYGDYSYRVKTKSTSNETSSYTTVKISLVEFYNVALNKNAFANTVYSSAYTADKAVDGDTITDTSRWVAKNVFPAILTVGLNGMYKINELRLYTGYQGYNTPITNFSFQYWDGSKWVNILSETANSNSQYKNTFTEVQTDSVRLYINAAESGLVRLFEMQVIGSQALTAGLKSNPAESIPIVYPNPTTGIVNFEDVNTEKSIEVIDLRGSLVYKTKSKNTIDLSFLSNGMYFVKVDNKVLKIIKE